MSTRMSIVGRTKRPHAASGASGWLAPETLIIGLLCFLTFICASVAGLLLGAAT